jgi:BirA family biotin operon repressor/biotin-[acetyl-CoA-carboxylase] ligase
VTDQHSGPAEEDAPFDVERLRGALASAPLYRDVVYLPVSPSTNTEALARARTGAPTGTLVLADEQPAGRGRVGRTWRSLPRQQILLSLVLRPAFKPHLLVMASALAVARAVEVTTPLAASIKWPNDVLVGGAKVCGILIETSSDVHGEPFAVVGIGLNVNGRLADDQELGSRARTLAELAGHPIERVELAAALLQELADLYSGMSAAANERQAVRDAWRARLETLGQQVRIQQAASQVHGLAEDVDADGTLLVRVASGELVPVTWGDVS